MLLSGSAVWPLAPSLSRSPWFTDNVTQGTLECLPQWPNMALPYPPHTYLNQSKDSININKILQAIEKLLHGCDV